MDVERMCPDFEGAFEILGKGFGLGLALRVLMARPRRFSQVTGYVDGRSDRMLSQRLTELEDAASWNRGST